MYPEERWEARVLEESILWDEYGMPYDPRRVLPRAEYKAHLAIIAGKREEQERQQKKMDNQSP